MIWCQVIQLTDNRQPKVPLYFTGVKDVTFTNTPDGPQVVVWHEEGIQKFALADVLTVQITNRKRTPTA